MSIILRQTFATTRWNKVIQLPISTKQVKLIHVSKCLVKSQEDTKGQVSPASNQKGAELSTSFAKKGTQHNRTKTRQISEENVTVTVKPRNLWILGAKLYRRL